MRERHTTGESQQDPATLMQHRSSSELAVAEQPRDREVPRLDRISARAHELYEARGAIDGRDLDDWLQAEREVDAVEES
jgi:hypothetical protein